MSSITRFDGNGIELAIDNETGAAYATISGYARMSGISQTAMSNRLSRGYKGVHKKDLKEAEILTPGGLQGVHLMTADLVFEWMIEDNPSLGFAMGKAGATLYMHQLAGFKVTSEPIAPTDHQLPATYIEALEALLESEKEKERLRVQNELQAAQIDDLEEDVDKYSSLADESFTHSSIVRIAKFNGINETAFKWRVLKAATKVAKLEIKRAPCPRFGEKLLYPHQAWAIAYPKAKLPENPDSAIGLKD